MAKLRHQVLTRFQDAQENFDQLTAVMPLIGTGSPEGVIPAPTGSLYLNRSGGTGTTLYTKESSPTPSTGWIGK